VAKLPACGKFFLEQLSDAAGIDLRNIHADAPGNPWQDLLLQPGIGLRQEGSQPADLGLQGGNQQQDGERRNQYPDPEHQAYPERARNAVALQPVDEGMEQISQAEGNQERRQDGAQQIDRQHQRAEENRPVPPGDAAQIQFGFFLGRRH